MCNGSESFLVDCTPGSLSGCDHSRDAAVKCGGKIFEAPLK